MDPLITASLIQGASSVGGSIAQGQANAAQMAYNDRQYERQRKDALSDWQMQTDYNSPVSQMARYRDAGLNKNLIYGQGTPGQAEAVRPTQAQQPKFESFRPNLDGFASGVTTYMDTRLKEAQLDNLKAMNSAIHQDVLLKAAQTIDVENKGRIGMTLNEVDFSGDGRTLFEKLKEGQLEVLKSVSERNKASTQMLLDENERRALVNVNTLQQGVERIATMRLGRQLTEQQIRSISMDAELKQKELELRKSYNLSSSDPVYIRLLTYFLDKFGFKP